MAIATHLRHTQTIMHADASMLEAPHGAAFGPEESAI